MNNTAAIFENQFPRIKKVNVVVEYGTPIYPKDLAPEDKKTHRCLCTEYHSGNDQ